MNSSRWSHPSGTKRCALARLGGSLTLLIPLLGLGCGEKQVATIETTSTDSTPGSTVSTPGSVTCTQPGALSVETSGISLSYWAGEDVPELGVGVTIETEPCRAFVAESSADWLVASLSDEGTQLTVTLDPAALVSGRHTGEIALRDQDQAAVLATVEVSLSALVSAGAAGTPHVLVVGVDGLDGDELPWATTPIIDRLAATGAWSWAAATQLTGATSSGPGWTSIMSGVEVTRHGITSNGDYQQRNTDHPSFLYLAKTELGLHTAASIQWTDIYDILEDDAFDEGFSGDQDEVTAAMADWLSSGTSQVHFVHLDDVDGAGHGYGFRHEEAEYIAAVEKADSDIGQLLEAVLDRPGVALEEWLFVVTSDHGGDAAGTHGGMTSDYQVIPLVVSGPSVGHWEIPAGEGSHLDIHPTVIDFLGLDPNDYTFDGRSVLTRETDCENGTDDDGDSLTDCEDPDCASTEACWSCDPTDLGSAIGTAVVSHILPSDNQLAGSCGGASGAELSFRWTAPSSGRYGFDTMEWYRDTVLYLLDGADCSGTELSCNDSPSSTARSAVAAELDAGQTVVAVVDSAVDSSEITGLSIYPFSTSCPDGSLGTGTGSTETAFSHTDTTWVGSCPPAIGDRWYTWTAPADGTYTFDTYGSDYDTVLYVLGSCSGTELGCNDDADGLRSAVEVELSASETVVVGVGGFGGRSASGTTVINVSGG